MTHQAHSDSEPEINEILLDDFKNSQNNDFSNQRKNYNRKPKKKHFIFKLLPRMYWLFYRHPLNFLVFIPSLTEGWANMVTTVAMGNILDAIHKDDALSIVTKNAIFSLLASVICAILAFINYTAWIIIGDKIGIKIKRILFKSFMEKDLKFFDSHSIGDLLILLQNDCSYVSEAFTESKTHQVSCFGKLLAALFVAFSVDWKLASISLFASISCIFIVNVFKQFSFKHFRIFHDYASQGMTIADESISNERIICSFNRQNEQLDLMHEKFDLCCWHDSISCMYLFFSFAFGNMINTGAICTILNLGAYFVIKTKITAGSLFTLSRAALWVGNEINHFFDTMQREQRAIDASKRIFEIVDLPVDIKDEFVDFDNQNYQENLEKNFRGRVEFRNVWFKYPTRDSWVLKDVSFEVDPSQITAVVGHSGSGKSTIVQLLLRFYDVNQGQILLDGVNIKDYRLSFLHNNIGVVQQDPRLFTMSIRDNIAYANPDATDSQIQNAARIANAAKFIEKLPHKYDTMCGEKGQLLSGGQIQRIAIARAIIEDPKLLITDEATSALDSESKSLVQAALDKVMEGRTSIIIAHRLGTIRAAKTIFVFDQGTIVESGTHEELLSRKGAYYNLVHRQLVKEV